MNDKSVTLLGVASILAADQLIFSEDSPIDFMKAKLDTK